MPKVTTRLANMRIAPFIPPGATAPTQVHLIVTMTSGNEFAVGFGSPQTLMEVLTQLMAAGRAVWPELAKMYDEVN